MTQPSSGQDLLNLLLRGGLSAGPSPSSSSTQEKNGNATGHQQSQLPPPISPSRPVINAQQSQKTSLSGQETLEALFSSLRSSAPPNANISPSAVNHAERQAQAASPSIAAASKSSHRAPATSPPLDNHQGRNLLLSMLNVRSIPVEETDAPSSSKLSLRDETLTQNKPEQDNSLIAGGIQITQSEDSTNFQKQPHDANGILSPLSRDLPPKEEESSPVVSTQAQGAPESEKVQTDQNIDNETEQQSPNKATYVQEGDSESPADREVSPVNSSRNAELTEDISLVKPSSESASRPQFPEPKTQSMFIDPEALVEESNAEPNEEQQTTASQDPIHEVRIIADPPSRNNDEEVTDRLPISRFTTAPQYCKGKQIAVNGLIAYGTRAGRVRVIDPDSGARLIKKLHSGLVRDMDMSSELVLDSERKIRRLATCYQNALTVWQIPSAFSTDDVPHPIVCEAIFAPDSTISTVKFCPSDPQLLLFTLSNDSAVYVIDLDGLHGVTPLQFHASDLGRFRRLALPSPVAAVSWSPDGATMVATSVDGHVEMLDLQDQATVALQLGSMDRTLGAPEGIELLMPLVERKVPSLLVTYSKGAILHMYDLRNLSRPSSRLVVEKQTSTEMQYAELFASVCKIKGFDTLAVSPAFGRTINLVSLEFPHSLSEDPGPRSLVEQVQSYHSRSSPGVTEEVLAARPRFAMSKCVTTPHEVLQMVVAELGVWPSIFYLHPEGFEQLSLSPAVFGTSLHESKHESLAAPVRDVSPTEDTRGDSPASILPRTISPALPQQAALQTGIPEAHRATSSANNSSSRSSGDSMLAAMQRHLAEQNLVFAQMLATQQQMQEARYLQLSRDIASLRSQQMDPFQRVSQAIRGELRDNLLPVIATALAETSQGSSAGSNTTASALEIHSEQLVERCLARIEGLFSTLSQQIGPAVTEALASSVDRYLARLTVNQAEQGDVMVQIREILLSEQMKREETTANFDAQLQVLKAQIDKLSKNDRMRTPGLYTGPAVQGTSHDIGPDNSKRPSFQPETHANGSNQERSATPKEEYEDLFLHALNKETDPLATLVDAAPPERMDRVLPYDGEPLISPLNLLTLCMRLAKEFDNNLETLDEGNGRIRLAWILACLRASKWAKANPQFAAYLPRVFTQVMHSLNARKKCLSGDDDIQLVDRVLRAADELSGLR